jgi:hypothetical protein
MINYFISTGCSFTEVVTPELWGNSYINIQDYPEYEFSWPLHVNNHLLATPCYRGKGASGNGIISRTTIFEVLNALKTYKPEEILVGIMWSGSYRHEIYLADPILDYHIHATGRINQDNPATVGGSASFYKVMPYWDDELSKNFYKYIYDDIGSNIQTLEHILRVQWFLKSYNIKYFMTTYHKEALPSLSLIEHQDIKYLYEQIDWDNFLDCSSEYEWCANLQDPKTWGVDHHPGTTQHKAFADQVIIPHLKKKGWI